MIPTIFAFAGGPTTVANTKQYSSRLTAVLAIMVTGKKLSILFVFKSKQSEHIARKELKFYPCLHYYICQKKALMEQLIWNYYIDIYGLSP